MPSCRAAARARPLAEKRAYDLLVNGTFGDALALYRHLKRAGDMQALKVIGEVGPTHLEGARKRELQKLVAADEPEEIKAERQRMRDEADRQRQFRIGQ